MTSAELARELGISPKTLRAWLRSKIERGAGKGTRWAALDDRIVEAARKRWRTSAPHSASRSVPSPIRVATPRREKRDRDQDVADLCDEVLGERARREHRFEWLLEDSGKDGKVRALPVDAYYPQHGLVVEYRERQHVQPVPHFDKPHVMTVSGVHRGEQRQIYDLRREREIPKHGLRLVIIPFDALDVDARGRLRRNLAADIAVIRALLQSSASSWDRGGCDASHRPGSLWLRRRSTSRRDRQA